MTGERTKLEALENKLGNICDENALVYRFHRDSYPITLIIRPDASPSGQLSMLENAGQCDTGFISQDASITFEFKDGSLNHRMAGQFDLSDALFSKLKNLFIKILFLWLQHFFREVMTNNLLAINAWPSINYTVDKKDSDGDDQTEMDEDDDTEQDSDTALDEDGDDVEGCEEETDGMPFDGIQMNDDMPPCEQETGEEITTPGLSEFAALVDEAAKIVIKAGSATTSMIQRGLNIGYSKATRIMEALEERGIVGPFSGSGPRAVLVENGNEAADA